MKPREELIIKDLRYDKYFLDDINYLIEFSYVIGKCCNQEMAEFDKLLEYCTSGIDLYSLFVIFCYEQYSFEICDYVEFLRNNIEELIVKFKDKYFEQDIEKRIEEIKKQLKYCEERDKVCLSIDGEQEVMELESELEELENKLMEAE